MNLRVSANEWYSVFCGMGSRLNNQNNEPNIRIKRMECRQLKVDAVAERIDFNFSITPYDTDLTTWVKVTSSLRYPFSPLDYNASMPGIKFGLIETT